YASEGVASLRKSGVRVIMATGDRPAAAQKVARALGISEVQAELSPGQKLALVQRLRKEGRGVAFVGDGINDAPALAASNLGVAIGAGTDVAQEAGQVILVRSDLRGVAEALTIGRRTVRKVRQNLWWAIGYNSVLLPIAAGALVPIFGFAVYQVLPMTGALAMGLSSTTVVLNSLSLRR
ncbi:MAG TPA: HAD-IC family P-type ATPase, partial [Thermoplasmata archaeon]|nr:HAD-IC family P-type ATPase [Thermoplasmata archaeon]